jgi:hypothetical protein
VETVKILSKTSFDRAFKKLSPQQQAAVRAAVSRLPESVGKPHLHAGTGIRSFGKIWNAAPACK